MQYKVEICSSIVVLVSLAGFIFVVLFIGFQFHIINMLIGEAKLAEEVNASKERRNQRLEEIEERKLTNLRLLRMELNNALKAIRGEDDYSSEDDYDGHNGIN